MEKTRCFKRVTTNKFGMFNGYHYLIDIDSSKCDDLKDCDKFCMYQIEVFTSSNVLVTYCDGSANRFELSNEINDIKDFVNSNLCDNENDWI